MTDQLQNTPAIGEMVLDPSDKFADLYGVDMFDLLTCDGSPVDQGQHAELYQYLIPYSPYNGTLLIDYPNQPTGAAVTGGYLWMSGYSSNVRRYTLEGVYTGFNFTGRNAAYGMGIKDGNIWITSGGTAYGYTTSGGSVGNFSISAAGTITDLTFLNGYWWVSGQSGGQGKVTQYTAAGVATGFSFTTATSSGIADNGTNLLLNEHDATHGRVTREITTDGVYTGFEYPTPLAGGSYGMSRDGELAYYANYADGVITYAKGEPVLPLISPQTSPPTKIVADLTGAQDA